MKDAICSLLLCFAFFMTTAAADPHNIDQLISEKIGRFSIDVYELSDSCRYVYQITEEQWYRVCLVGDQLSAVMIEDPQKDGVKD